MISGWLIKVLVGIAVLGFLVMEVGSPLIARAQADDAAHEIANEVAFQLRSTFTQDVMDKSCTTEAEKRSVKAECSYDSAKNLVNVRVTKEARSFVFAKVSALKSWYEVDASATASPK